VREERGRRGREKIASSTVSAVSMRPRPCRVVPGHATTRGRGMCGALDILGFPMNVYVRP
jgi:hypothetical protein